MHCYIKSSRDRSCDSTKCTPCRLFIPRIVQEGLSVQVGLGDGRGSEKAAIFGIIETHNNHIRIVELPI